MQLVGGFFRRSPVSRALSFRRRCILTSITIIGSQDHHHRSLDEVIDDGTAISDPSEDVDGAVYVMPEDVNSDVDVLPEEVGGAIGVIPEDVDSAVGVIPEETGTEPSKDRPFTRPTPHKTDPSQDQPLIRLTPHHGTCGADCRACTAGIGECEADCDVCGANCSICGAFGAYFSACERLWNMWCDCGAIVKHTMPIVKCVVHAVDSSYKWFSHVAEHFESEVKTLRAGTEDVKEMSGENVHLFVAGSLRVSRRKRLLLHHLGKWPVSHENHGCNTLSSRLLARSALHGWSLRHGRRRPVYLRGSRVLHTHTSSDSRGTTRHLIGCRGRERERESDRERRERAPEVLGLARAVKASLPLAEKASGPVAEKTSLCEKPTMVPKNTATKAGQHTIMTLWLDRKRREEAREAHRREDAVVERLACSPATKANWVQSPATSLPNLRMWGSCRTMQLIGGFSRDLPFYPALSFRHRSIFTSITLIDLQYLTVESSPNLFTYSLHSLNATTRQEKKESQVQQIVDKRVSNCAIGNNCQGGGGGGRQDNRKLWRGDIDRFSSLGIKEQGEKILKIKTDIIFTICDVFGHSGANRIYGRSVDFFVCCTSSAIDFFGWASYNSTVADNYGHGISSAIDLFL
ncbi:hypothetical protein PR048_015733 [Dryococelus australis]|uniref:Uncharacterized protein n=1 Tax=Dryococelus australis TaxID=614101 RepID=A0ABQ9HHT4_9NEOP|nr:hypothetical protein PR048_015733 [Dryococelus australis]